MDVLPGEVTPRHVLTTNPLLTNGVIRRLTLRPAIGLLALLGIALPAQGQSIVQEFFVPMPEAQIRQSFLAVASNTGNTFDSVISIVVPVPGTQIVYDHWEDGYEADINAPVQSSTRVWGDGNDANGKPPGYASDPVSFSSGDVIALRNFVPLPRTSAILYDGRDRIGATQAIVVSRSAWATTPGPLLADATEVPSTADYGTSFTIPLGQNIIYPSPNSSSMFEFCSLFVMAAQNGTVVHLDADGNGSAETTFNLNRGESYLANGGVNKGATVTASKPVQVQLVTGDIGANYENRWFTIPPTEVWSSEYYSPVGTAADGDETYIWLYNPDASAITVNYLTKVSSGSFNIPAKDTYRFLMPQNSGAKFSSVGSKPMSAVGTVGARPSQNNVHDWGFSLVPTANLTTELVVGWGPGSRDLSQNGSPAWVTAVAPTTIYMDYDGDRLGAFTDINGNGYDTTLTVGALEVSRIYESADKDQTGLRLYTLDGTLITGAWGQDPAVAGPAEPFLDVGTTIPNLPVPVLSKTVELVTDNGNAGPSLNSPADEVEFTITLENKGLFALSAIQLSDVLPAGLAYVAGTTTRDAVAVSDAANPTTLFPLDEGGILIPLLLRNSSTVVKFRATITASGQLTNVATTTNPTLSAKAVVIVPGVTPFDCTLFLTTSGGIETDYEPGAGIYVTLTDADANTSSGSQQTVSVVVENLSNGDLETLLLTETGNNTGVFRNDPALPSSTTLGGLVEDGTIRGVLGDTLSVSYTDPVYGGAACSDTATFVAATLFKQLYLDTDGGDDDLTGDLDRVDPVATADGTTSQTAVISPPVSSTDTYNTPGTTDWTVPAGVTSITVQAWGGGGAGGGSTSAGTFSARGGGGGGGGAYATSVLPVTPGQLLRVTVAGTAAGVSGATGSNGSPSFVGPDSNPANAVVRAAGGTGGTGNTGGGSPAGGAGGTTAASVGTTTVAGATGGNGATGLGISSGAGGSGASGGGSGGAAVTSTGSSADGNPGTAPGGAGSGSRTSQNAGNRTGGQGASGRVVIAYNAPAQPVVFTQTPTFCAPFTMPAGGTITVKSYYTMVAGSIGSAITATLKYGATTFFTDTTATAGSDANGTYLQWSVTLGSPVTVPAEEAITLTVTSGLATGNTFRIQYDSSGKPSLISLPTTTVVTVDSVGVYDAPYPGGSLVTTPFPGQPLYVRTVVSDPFGAYDITGIDPLTIVDPLAQVLVNVPLNDTFVVDSTTCSKTYEYAWTAGMLDGTYTITVTAQEGFEDAVTDSKSTIVTISSLDLGTPCQTEFTSTLNGASTTTYALEATIFVRVTDVDENTDSGVAETVTASITSSTGDIEVLTLVETGINTGVFTNGVPSSATGSVNNNNGTLWATSGSSLTLDYVDDDDPLDPCSTGSTIPSGSPAVLLVKTLLSPSDGQIIVGETAQFRIRVSNTGDTTLTTVEVVDTFDTSYLNYVTATPTPDNTSPAGTLTWNDVGPIAPGGFVDILVDFTGVASADPTVNDAVVTTAQGPTDDDDAEVIITNPQLTVTKTRLTPASGTVNLGDTQSFRIVVQNTGDTILTTVPLEDTFSAACLEYVGATVLPDSTSSGSLLWNDLTGAGTLAVGASVTVDVTFKVVGGCDPADNVAAVNFAVDEYDDPVPPDEDDASVETAAASLSGTVYEDQGAAGFDDPNDVPLENVVVRLFTDPNGDGDPTDGVQVAVTTTDVNGYYEFLNLGLGDYVVVEEDPIGYFSVDDTEGAAADNRIGVEIATLTDHPGNDFLDDEIDTSLYGSISGQVRDDVDADADFGDPDAGISGVNIYLYTDPNGDGNPNDGVLFATTMTDGLGNYSFPSIPPGNYVVVELDPAGYGSTADVVGANDNQIPATVPNNTAVTGRDFLDTLNEVRVGNRIWNDNGAGGGVANDGVRNGSEPGISGVTVEVYAADGFGNPAGVALGTTTTDASGYYFFTLPAGEYVIVVPASNFDNGGDPLFGLYSSGTSNGTWNGVDPDLNLTDSDDNGFNAIDPATSGVRTAAFTLTLGGEPTGETDLGPGDAAVPDLKSNLTVDLGFVNAPPTAVTLAYVRAFRDGGQVMVEWETITEQNTVGFDVYRVGADGARLRVNAALVPALNSDRGGVYRVTDAGAADGPQLYELDELETTGRTLTYGPFTVEVQAAAAARGVRVTEAGLTFEFLGEPGAEYVVESTDDLYGGRWRVVARVRADEQGLLRWLETGEQTGTMRFFRALRP